MRLVTISSRSDVAIVELTDPATMNAASIEMVEQLTAAFDEAERTARAIILTGEGKGFCSGANLGMTLDPGAPDYDAGAYLDSHYNPLMRRIRDLRVPLVTAVNGAAAGIGAAIALAGDLIVASERAFFLQAFRNIGLVPDGGSATLLLHAAGRARAMEMMMLGERVHADKAQSWGMVNRVVAPDALIDTAMSLASSLAEGPTTALAMIRSLGWRSLDTPFDTMLDIERAMQRQSGRTDDHREGVDAFLTKRRPVFSGR